MKRNLGLSFFLLVTTAVSTGCAKLKEMDNTAPPGRVVAISPFKCNCEPIVRESVQDSFVDVFFKYTNAKPVKGENGDITIVGIITMEEGHTGRTKGGVFGGGSSGSVAIGGSSSGASASGTYISGITVQAYKNGELVATHSVGQNLGKGVLFSPVSIANDAARYISTILVRQNEIGRR